MTVRVVSVALVIALLSFGLALAHSYEDLTVEEIRALQDFVADDYSLSSATNSGDEDAAFAYHWIGYIPHGDQRIYFTSNGESLTCVEWEATGEWVPAWVVEALDRLLNEGYIKLD